jgi:hypothetical protein
MWALALGFENHGEALRIRQNPAAVGSRAFAKKFAGDTEFSP